MLRLLCVAALIAALSLSASAADAVPSLERRVMAEISFDLALNQEGEGGYSASHAVSQYLSDEGLLWLRYFHSLASGTSGNAPMRVAMMEFKNRTAWGSFEQRHLGVSQVLYDLFWINWRRVLWRTTDESSEFAPLSKERDTDAIAGFVWSFRYSPKAGREQVVKDLIRSHAPAVKRAAESYKDFLEKRTFAAGSFQSHYKFLELYEFSSMEGLTEFTDDSSEYGKLLEALLPELSDYATTIYVPGNQNGRILAGQGAVLLSEAAKAQQQAVADAVANTPADSAASSSASQEQEQEQDEDK